MRWLATATLPVVTVLVAQHFTSRAAREQRDAEYKNQHDVRTQEQEAREREQELEREGAAAEAARAEKAAETARLRELLEDALDAIHALQAQLTTLHATGQMDDNATRHFAVALGRLRIFLENEQGCSTPTSFDPGPIITKIAQQRWGVASATELKDTMALIGQLNDLAKEVFGEGFVAMTLLRDRGSRGGQRGLEIRAD